MRLQGGNSALDHETRELTQDTSAAKRAAAEDGPGKVRLEGKDYIRFNV